MLQKKGSAGNLSPGKTGNGPFLKYHGIYDDMDALVKSIRSRSSGATSGCFIPVDFVGMRGIKVSIGFSACFENRHGLHRIGAEDAGL
jgi:hypothetical protein